jgi:hypothetical protein
MKTDTQTRWTKTFPAEVAVSVSNDGVRAISTLSEVVGVGVTSLGGVTNGVAKDVDGVVANGLVALTSVRTIASLVVPGSKD